MDYKEGRYVAFFEIRKEDYSIKKKLAFFFNDDELKMAAKALFSFLATPNAILKISDCFFEACYSMNQDFRFSSPSSGRCIFDIESLIKRASENDIANFCSDSIILNAFKFPEKKKLSDLVTKDSSRINFADMLSIQRENGDEAFSDKAKDVIKKYAPAFYDQTLDKIVFPDKKGETEELLKFLSDKKYFGMMSGKLIDNNGKLDFARQSNSAK